MPINNYRDRFGELKTVPVCCKIKDIENHSASTFVGGFIHNCACPTVLLSGVSYYTIYELCGGFDPSDFGTDADGYRNRYRKVTIYVGGNGVDLVERTRTYARNPTTGFCESSDVVKNLGPSEDPRPPNKYENLDTWAAVLADGVEQLRLGESSAYYEPKPSPAPSPPSNGRHEKQRSEYFLLCTRLVPGITYTTAVAKDFSDQPAWTYVEDGAIYDQFVSADVYHILGGSLNPLITPDEFKANDYSLSRIDYGLPVGDLVINPDGSLSLDYPAEGTAIRLRQGKEVDFPASKQCYINTIPE